MKLYAVIPVINCLELTQEAIKSIGTPCTVIVVDNNSTDGTEDFFTHNNRIVTKGNPLGAEIIYIRNHTPRSVAASWNQGVKKAFEDPECQYVAILNNDIVLHPKTISNLMAFMDHTGYLMVTGDNIKGKMSIDVLLTMELEVPFTDFDTWKIEGWRAEGPDFSCYLINRDTIRVIGWFDEHYERAYCEDQDYHARCSMARKHIEKHNDQGIDVARVHFKRLSTAPYYHYASQSVARVAEIRHDVALAHANNQNYYYLKFGADHPEAMDGKGFEQPFGDASKNWRDC